MYAQDSFVGIAQRVVAVVAQFQAKLVFVLGAKTTVTFAAGGVGWPLVYFLDVNF